MGKRSDFERKPRDFYPTPIEAVVPLISHLPKKGLFAEPCAGDGRLIKHIEELSNLKAYWMTDIEPQVDWVGEFDVFDADVSACDICITNPPWDRKILHPMIEHLAEQTTDFKTNSITICSECKVPSNRYNNTAYDILRAHPHYRPGHYLENNKDAKGTSWHDWVEVEYDVGGNACGKLLLWCWI